MPESEIDTGQEQLDSDLRLLFEANESGQLAKIREEIADAELTLEQFREKVPAGLLRIGTVVSSPLNFRAVSDSTSKKARPLLERAKRIADGEMESILSHRFAAKRLSEALGSELQKTEPTGFARNFNIITQIDHVPTWFGSPPNLTPGVRVGFMSKRAELLLDTSMNWDDLFFVVSGLVQIGAQSMKAAKPLQAQKQLQFDTSELRSIGARLKEISRALAEIHDLADSYGIPIDDADEETSKPPARDTSS